MVEMLDLLLTEETFSILQVPDGCMEVVKAFQRAVLEIHPGYGRVFQLHERKPVYLHPDICDRKVFLHQMHQVDMGLHQVACGRRQPASFLNDLSYLICQIERKLADFLYMEGNALKENAISEYWGSNRDDGFPIVWFEPASKALFSAVFSMA